MPHQTSHAPVVAVIFDLDGVIVASEHLWDEGWRRVIAGHGGTWDDDDTRACQGKSVPEWAAYLGQRAGIAADAARKEVVDFVLSAYDRGDVAILPGAADMVNEAADRVPIGMATSAPPEVIARIVQMPELSGRFSVAVSSAEVARGKPSPDVYEAAIARLGADPHVSLAVEDSSNGIRAANAAGLTVIGIEHAQYPVAGDARECAAAIYTTVPAAAAELIRRLDLALARAQ
ncbi:MAG: HAD family hydrolase [Nostocoides sp.]